MLPSPQDTPQIFGFGSVKNIYPVRKATKWSSLILTIVFLISSVLVFGYGAVNTFNRWQKYGSALIWKTFSGPLVISIVLFFFGILIGWQAYSNSKKLVTIYDHGFAFQNHRGINACKWEEVDSILSAITRHYTNGIYTGTTHVYTIRKADGKKIVINDVITNVEAVASQIKQFVYPMLYQRNAQAYNSGKRLVFGPIGLSKSEGVLIGKKQFPWDQISQVKINKGYLNFAKKDGGWFSGATASVSTIPNHEVLLSIIDQAVGIKVN
jgi:hypothetical protein